MKYITYIILSLNLIFSQKMLIPMDNTQSNHLKSYVANVRKIVRKSQKRCIDKIRIRIFLVLIIARNNTSCTLFNNYRRYLTKLHEEAVSSFEEMYQTGLIKKAKK